VLGGCHWFCITQLSVLVQLALLPCFLYESYAEMHALLGAWFIRVIQRTVLAAQVLVALRW
jgi:hypothetical protein